MMRALFLCSLLGLVVGGAGCIGGGDSGGADDSKTVVGPEGLTLTLSGRAKLVIPEGALRQATSIGFRSVDADALPALPRSLSAMSDIYELTPHGLTLEKSVQLTMPHRAPTTRGLKVMRLENASATVWRQVDSGATIGADSVTLDLSGFSFYVVVQDLSEFPDAAVDGSGGSMDGSGGSMDGSGGSMDGSGGSMGGAGGAMSGSGGEMASGGCSVLCVDTCGNGQLDDNELCDGVAGTPNGCSGGTATCRVQIPAGVIYNEPGTGLIYGPAELGLREDAALGFVPSELRVDDGGTASISDLTLNAPTTVSLETRTFPDGTFVIVPSAQRLSGFSVPSALVQGVPADIEPLQLDDGGWTTVITSQTLVLPDGASLVYSGGYAGGPLSVQVESLENDDASYALVATSQTVSTADGGAFAWSGGSISGPVGVRVEARKDGDGRWTTVATAQTITAGAAATVFFAGALVQGEVDLQVGPEQNTDGSWTTIPATAALDIPSGGSVSWSEGQAEGPLSIGIEARQDTSGTWVVLASAQTVDLTTASTLWWPSGFITGPAQVQLQIRQDDDGTWSTLPSAQTVRLLAGGDVSCGQGYVDGPLSVRIEPRQDGAGAWVCVLPAQTLSPVSGSSISWSDGGAAGPVTVQLEPKQDGAGTWVTQPLMQTISPGVGGSAYWSGGSQVGPADVPIVSRENDDGSWASLAEGRIDYGSCGNFRAYITYASSQNANGDWISTPSGPYCIDTAQCSMYSSCGTN